MDNVESLSYSDSCSDEEIDEYEDLTPLEEIVQKNMSKNLRLLADFLRKFVVEPTDARANITNVVTKKSYAIPEIDMEEFFTLVEAARLEGRSLHFVEHQESAGRTHSGLSVDFNIYQTKAESQLEKEFFTRLARAFSSIINQFLDLEPHATKYSLNLHYFILQAPVVRAKTKTDQELYKDSFRVVIPELQTTTAVKRFIVQEILDRAALRPVFRDLETVDDPCASISRSSATAHSFIYGNAAGACQHALTRIICATFDIGSGDAHEHINISAVDGFNLSYELSLLAHTRSIRGAQTWLVKRQINHLAHVEARIVAASERIIGPLPTERETEDISIVGINNPKAAYIMRLMNIVDTRYATDRKLWVKAVRAVANCGTNDDYKVVAAEFSKRGPWNPEEFERIWAEAVSSTSENPVTLGSIKHWAKVSSPQAYMEIEKDNYGTILRRAAYEGEGRVNQAAVSRVLHAMCGDRFAVAVDPTGGRNAYLWFEFVTPGQAMRKGEVYKWRLEPSPSNLHLFISDQLPKIYAQVRDNIKTRKEDAKDPAEKKYWDAVDSKFRDCTNNLGEDRNQTGIINQCRHRFKVHGFLDELDSYEDIIGVGNGIVKLGEQPQLIRGFHEYKISKFTTTDYEPFDPVNNQYQRTLLRVFREIFPEEDVFHFMLFHASTGVDACEASCLTVLLVGGGQNGKSSFLKFVHNALGNEYSASGKPALLTAPNERSENANSAQMQQMGKRYFYMDEFQQCETINTARLKAISSPVWQSGRELYGRQRNFKNTSNPIAASNFDFIVETTDHGTWRRIYYYRNKVKFTAEPDPDNPYERLADDRFATQYPNDPAYQRAMLSIMVHYRAVLQREFGGDLKRVPVPTIARETEIFRNRQDYLNKFLTESLIKSPSSTDPITINALAQKYISWYNINVKAGNAKPVSVVCADLENSQISSDFTACPNGLKKLHGYRIIDSTANNQLAPDESYIGARRAREAQDVSGCRPNVGYDVDEICGLKKAVSLEDWEEIAATEW